MSVALLQVIVLSDAALSIIPPPSAVSFVGVVTVPISMCISSTWRVVLFTIVCVPFTVRVPLTIKSSNVTSSVVFKVWSKLETIAQVLSPFKNLTSSPATGAGTKPSVPSVVDVAPPNGDPPA